MLGRLPNDLLAPAHWFALSRAPRPARRGQPRCCHQLGSAQRSSSRPGLNEPITISPSPGGDEKRFGSFLWRRAAIQPFSTPRLLLFFNYFFFQTPTLTPESALKNFSDQSGKRVGEVTTLHSKNHLGKGVEKEKLCHD